MNLFVCGAKPEYDFVKEMFGHEDGVVQYTGLARYDNLHDIKAKRQVLLMPTWRGYIHSKEEFLSSDYYRQWQGLLSNERLTETLESNGLDLIFYPHYEFQKYLGCFHVETPCVKIASFDKYDVQTLLKESILLITDYSSVFFDFGYMRKPVIYFQFDADDFFDKHHERGYFDHVENGFGRVCVNVAEVADEVQKCIDNDFVIDKMYSKRLNTFFPLHDTNNCQRIYMEIIRR